MKNPLDNQQRHPERPGAGAWATALCALLLICLLAPHALAQNAAADSVAVPPSRLRYRSVLEEFAAMPGMVMYLPFRFFFSIDKYVANGIWNQRLIDRAKALLTTADGRAGVRPLASTQIGTGGHVFYKNLLLRGDAGLTSSWGSSSSKRQHHTFVLSWPNGRVLPGALKFTADYNQRPKGSFYGIGHLTQIEDRATLLEESLYLRLNYQRRLNPQLALGAEVNYHSTDIRDGLSQKIPSMLSRYRREQAPGLDVLAHYVETSATLHTDFVDVQGSPTRGYRTLLNLGYTQSVDGSDLSHLSLLVITEQFLELFYRRTISLRLGTEWRLAPGDNRIPFYELVSLGGTEFLRGYKAGRFRDHGSAFARTSYKYPIWKLVEGSLFYESGRTFHRPGDFNLDHWKSSYGGGLRIWVPEGLVFEQVIAISAEETRLLFNLSTLF